MKGNLRREFFSQSSENMDMVSDRSKSPYKSVNLGDISQTMIGGAPFIEKIDEHPKDSEG